MQDFEPFLQNPSTAALIRSGQFAELCQTTKETLRHYRSIGLLEPAAVGENGYALYSPLQLSDFLLISALKNAGCSLDEIHGYLANPLDACLEPLIEERIAAIDEQRRTLLHQQHFLENTLARARALNSWSDAESSFRIQNLPRTYFVDTDLSDLFIDANEVVAGGELELMDRVAGQWAGGLGGGTGGELQGCYRIGLEALQQGTPEQDFHLCMPVPHTRASRPKANWVLRPGGEYFQQLRSINLEELLLNDAPLFGVYSAFLQELERQGLRPIGDVYEQELSLYSGSFSQTIYSELSVQVERM